jgi:hypothetical protein
MSFENPAFDDDLFQVDRESEANFEGEPIIEKYRGIRAELMGKIFNRKNAEVAMALTPGLDIGMFLSNAIKGKTPLTGTEVSARERMNSVVMAGLFGLVYTMRLSGMHHGAWNTLVAIEFGPDVIDGLIKMTKEKFPAVSSFVEKTAGFVSEEYLKNGQNLMEDVRVAVKKTLTNSPDIDFNSLNLNG